MDIKQIIRTVEDFPVPGVKFLDVTSILENPEAFKSSVRWFRTIAVKHDIQSIVAIDARGFIWASAVAADLHCPLFLARKSGKLPGEVVSKDYSTEYSQTSLSMLKSNNIQGPVLVVDDILATGGTLAAVGSMLTEHWNIPADQQIHGVVVNLDFLPGKKNLTTQGYTVESMTDY